jgi:23S rRNA (guanosine2251-2'-O)-methyltransferase
MPKTLARRDWGDRPGRAPLAVDPTRESAQGDSERFGAEASSDLIWGRHSSLAVLESGRPIHRIWCTTEMRFTPNFLQLLREAKSSGVLVEEVTWARLGQISGGAVHQGIVLQTAAAETLDLPTLIDGCRGLGESPLLLAVDGLTDPHNLGAIVRSAEALGAHGLVLPQRRNAGLTGTVAKVAAGALENLPVARVVNLNRSLDALKQEGYRVVGLAAEGNHTLEEADLDGPLVIVTGSESEGLSLLTRRSCDQLVRIPLRGVTPSLNASVATALLVYEIARRGWMKGITGSQPAPRISRPQVAQPARPETATPEPEAPELAGPELAGPQAPAGQLDALASDSPGKPLPASFNPEPATPEAATPKAATPKAATPKAATAEAATPTKAATAETGTATADSEARDPGPQQALAPGSGEPLPAAEAPAVATEQIAVANGQTAVANGQTAGAIEQTDVANGQADVATAQIAGANGPTAGAKQQAAVAAGKTAAEPDQERLPASAAAAGAGTLGSQGPAASAPQPLALGLQPRPATGFDGDIQL